MTQPSSGVGLNDVTMDPSSPYYVGPLDTNQESGGEIRAQATAEIDQEIAKGWFGPAVTPQARDAAIQSLYEQQISNARQEVVNGLQLRSPGTPPQTMWENATHEQMQQAITQNADSVTLAGTSEEWVSLGNELTDHQRDLAAAITDSMSDWQGAGGDAVREHLANVGQWLGTTASGATLTGRQQEIHSQVLNETQKRMAANPPVQFSPQQANAQLQTITDPVQYAAQAAQDTAVYQQQQAAREEAARTMTQFDGTVASASTTPEFAAPPKLATSTATTPSTGTPAFGLTTASPRLPTLTGAGAGGPGGATMPGMANLPAAGMPSGGAVPSLDGSGSGGSGGSPLSGGDLGGGSGVGGGPNVRDLSGGDVSGGSSLGGGLATGDSGSGRGTGSTSGAGAANVPPLGEVNVPDSGPGLSSRTTASSAGDPNMPSIGWSGGVTGGGIAHTLGGGPSAPTSFPTSNVPTLGDVPGGGGTTGLIGGGSAGASLGGLGGAGGGGGSAASAASRLGSGGGLKGTSGTGGSSLSSGASSGAGASEESAAGRAAGASGSAAGPSSSNSASSMGRGSGGKKEDDKEHRVAAYLEGDPDFFQGEQVIAPPVIGDWKANKDFKKKPGGSDR